MTRTNYLHRPYIVLQEVIRISCKKCSRLNVRTNTFSNRVVDTWNNLPETVVNAPSVNTFKSRLNKHWHGHPTKFVNQTSQPTRGIRMISKSIYTSQMTYSDVEYGELWLVINFGFVRMYVTHYRTFWIIFTSDLVISYIDKMLYYSEPEY